MGTKPTSAVSWATDATFASGDETGQTTRADPSGIRAQGIKSNQRIPARWFNFITGAAGDWIQYLDAACSWARNAVAADNVDNTGATDTTTALQAAVDALAGDGTLVLIGGTYKITNKITIQKGVSIKCVGAVYLMMDHASHNWLEYPPGTADVNAHGTSQPDVVEGLYFGALQDNTGVAIYVTTSANVIFRGCGFNVHAGTKHIKGQFYLSTVDCKIDFVKAQALFIGDNNNFENDTGRLHLSGVDFTTTSGFNSRMVENLGAGELTIDGGSRFDCGNSSGGACSLIYLSGVSSATIDDCVFLDGDGNSNHAIEFIDGIQINMGDAVSFRNIIPYVATGLTARGSKLTTLPVIKVDLGSGSTYLLDRAYSSIWLECSAASAPNLTLSDALYIGQTLDVFIQNKHGSGSWSGAPTFSPADADDTVMTSNAQLAPLPNGQTLAMRFVAVESVSAIGGQTLLWAQCGAATILTDVS